jgi:hypothetical protein
VLDQRGAELQLDLGDGGVIVAEQAPLSRKHELEIPKALVALAESELREGRTPSEVMVSL